MSLPLNCCCVCVQPDDDENFVQAQCLLVKGRSWGHRACVEKAKDWEVVEEETVEETSPPD